MIDFLNGLLFGDGFREAYLEARTVFSGVFEGGRLEKLYKGSEVGLSLRSIKGDFTRFGYTGSLDSLDVERLASEVFGRSRKVSPPVVEPPYIGGVASFLKLIEDVHRELWGFPFVRQVTLHFGVSVKRMWVSNSEGVGVFEERPYFTAMVNMVGERNGVVQTFRESYGGTFYLYEADVSVLRGRFLEAAKKLDSLLSAPSSPKGTMTVVISGEAGGTMIHEAVGHGLEADLVYKEVSVYRGRVGEKVASEKITVVDDPTMPFMRGSYRYDDEGTESRRNVLIENGILKGYLSDLKHLKLVKGALPGNGRRESYRHPPIPRMSNTFVDRGPDKVEDIVSSVGKGLFVRKMGGGQVNTVNGDFVFEVMEGYVIENGRIGDMVKGATLLGNGPKVLMEIDMVGDDLGFSIGTCGKDGQGVPVSDGQPTLRIPSILVGGKE